ncbi:hypothetical protein LWF01_15465 [Saxibacter everestensis]|uniref:DUF1311 domain-containing protein n=1 Tax=Saxibacter everestensis TaxID=2909229 RepID=A0ABY8QR95_9MICO|nr:hypothetical protein LWF01_15465 [Brevibacteriaceae bacterium ZFBP1038]
MPAKHTPGKHKSARRRATEAAWIVVAVVIAVVGGLGVWSFTTRSADDASSSADPAATGSSTAGNGGATSNPSAGTEARDTRLADCRRDIAAGEIAVEAASASYRDWSSHVNAERDHQNGKRTLAETEELWAKSRANGDEDVSRFKDAEAALQAAGDGCGKLASTEDGGGAEADDAADKDDNAIGKCLRRDTAIDKVVSAGTQVNSQWESHLRKMKTKSAVDPMTYHREWLDAVEKAVPILEDFRAAQSSLDEVPACPAA